MLDPGSLELVASQGDRLTTNAYRSDFRQRRMEISRQDCWKLERRQQFEEQDSSWQAVRRGSWEEALRLLEDKREGLLSATRRDQQLHTVFRRVRVVEEPLTPYLQWELHALRVQAESGRVIRVIDSAELAELERAGPLPEVVVLGDQALYQVVYTEAGALDGAVRFREPTLIARWASLVRELYEAGEELLPFFERRVADLPPPRATAE
ncbi:DUF6879 family protein [Streptomyces sp. NPDC059398]|uniref:DUF6879 family protein n=1 Tax=Streptomyces sp. NPDC059398 TaxID=3346820 RepID=UPI0036C973B2